MTELEQRLLEVAHNFKLSHIGSALTALPIIDEIYKIKKDDEKFVLSAGHAFLAQLIVMESRGQKLPEKIPTHPETWLQGVGVPTGSLGMGLPISTGLALAHRDRNVYCLISDGEATEGSVWESLRIAGELGLDNLKVYCNANGFGAYGNIDVDLLEKRLHLFFPVKVVRTKISDEILSKHPQLIGLGGHYNKI